MMSERDYFIMIGVIRPGVHLIPIESDRPIFRLAPGERERFEAAAKQRSDDRTGYFRSPGWLNRQFLGDD